MNVKDKVVVITGGAGGIGLAIVKKLLSKNIKFIGLFDLDTQTTRDIFKELEKEYGSRVGFYPCDVTISVQLSENFDKVIASHNTIDVLINNAGILQENTYERMIDINFKAVVVGSLLLIERVGKHKGGPGATIINMASILGLKNFTLPIYCSTKHGVVSFTRTMRDCYDATGTRVVAICPGVTTTPLLSQFANRLDFVHSEGKFDSVPTQPPENVAEAVLKIIESGKCGDVWVSEDSKPPYAVREIEDYKSLRIADHK